MIFRAVLLAIVLVQVLARQPGPECTCSTCYRSLESALLDNDGNVFNISRGFYPPYLRSTIGNRDTEFGDRAYGKDPVFATIVYLFESNLSNGSSVIDYENKTIWFWAESEYYLLVPIEVFGFLSLFFGKTWFHTTRIFLTLPSVCQNVPNKFLEFLTHRVSI